MADLEQGIEKLEQGVKQAKVALARADEAANKYKITEEHYAKIDRAESGFNKLLSFFPIKQGKAAKIKGLESQLGLLTLLAAVFLIFSTLGLYLITNRSDEEYEN